MKFRRTELINNRNKRGKNVIILSLLADIFARLIFQLVCDFDYFNVNMKIEKKVTNDNPKWEWKVVALLVTIH